MARQSIEIEFVKNDASYKRALKRVARFFDQPPKVGTPDDTEFGLLLLMCARYETEHHPVPPPDPVAAIEFALPGNLFHWVPAGLWPVAARQKPRAAPAPAVED